MAHFRSGSGNRIRSKNMATETFGSEYAIMPNGLAMALNLSALDCCSAVNSLECLPSPACTLAVMSDEHIVTDP